jgi:hypothetical protein
MRKVLSLWVKIAIPVFFAAFFFIDRGKCHYYLGPALLLSCFIPVVPKKWKVILLFLLGLMMVVDLGARSQVIKSVVTFMIGAAYLLSKFLKPFLLKVAHWVCYIAPVVILYLAINGVYNPFQSMAENASGKYIETRNEALEHDEDIADDTRTHIYEEVIESAVKHDYIWHGRTPARGNDSWVMIGIWKEIGMDPVNGKYERHENEVCHTNVFTWLGLIGVIMYGLIYLKSSYLSVYRSNSFYMKLLGVFIAFRWAFGWMEDMNNFDISNVSLWMMIAMGFSEDFRRMNDQQFKEWIVKIFAK